MFDMDVHSEDDHEDTRRETTKLPRELTVILLESIPVAPRRVSQSLERAGIRRIGRIGTVHSSSGYKNFSHCCGIKKGEGKINSSA